MTAFAAATIGRLRVPAVRASPARQAVERWLASVEPQRYGLPATAVLVVRRARSRLFALSERSANDPLAGIVRNAVRPGAAGFVGAGVDAVWFADEAELLACLARDALAGSLAACWWWAALLGPAPSAAGAARRWQACARWVPQALALLAQSGDDSRWLERLGPPGRRELLDAVAAAFEVCAEVRAALAEGEAATVAGHDATPSPVPYAAMPPPVIARAPARTDPVTAWLRLARALLDDPQRAGSAGFASVIVATLAQVLDLGRDARGAAPGAPPARDATAIAPGAPQRKRRSNGGMAPSMPPALRQKPLRRSGSIAADAGAALPATAPGRVEDADDAATAPLAAGAQAAPPAPGPMRHESTRRAAATPALASAVFETAFGGLFFLLNVALAIGLYGDFTRPLHRGLPVSPWRFLAGAARAWVGRDFAADPLAEWLCERAPSTGVPESPACWIADPDWLRDFAADSRPWHAVIAPDALRLQHAAGFTIARQTGVADLTSVLAAIGAPGHPVCEHRCLRGAGTPADILQPLWPLLGARLVLALGMPARHATRLLLALPARVQATPARLDLHFSLAALPLALRIAGLDRDPGWVPAAGCDIRFHFA